MSRRGNCLDNAPIEGFFPAPKNRRVQQVDFRTRSTANAAVIQYMECFTIGNVCTRPSVIVPQPKPASHASSRRGELLPRASHRTVRAGHAYGSLDRSIRFPAPAGLIPAATDSHRSHRRRDLSFSCSSLDAAGDSAARMRPVARSFRPPKGCRRARGPIAVVPSFSIHLSLRSTGFHRLRRYYEEIRLPRGRRPVVVASFRSTARADPRGSP